MRVNIPKKPKPDDALTHISNCQDPYPHPMSLSPSPLQNSDSPLSSQNMGCSGPYPTILHNKIYFSNPSTTGRM